MWVLLSSSVAGLAHGVFWREGPLEKLPEATRSLWDYCRMWASLQWQKVVTGPKGDFFHTLLMPQASLCLLPGSNWKQTGPA